MAMTDMSLDRFSDGSFKKERFCHVAALSQILALGRCFAPHLANFQIGHLTSGQLLPALLLARFWPAQLLTSSWPDQTQSTQTHTTFALAISQVFWLTLGSVLASPHEDRAIANSNMFW